ncbi:MAG: helix-turn-helix domain-containing protein [Serratia proteamaculans]
MTLSDEQKAKLAEICSALNDDDDGLKREVLTHTGNRCSLSIIYALGTRGPLRHAELGRAITGVTQRMLTRTLRHLERDGLISRHDFQQKYPHPHVEYRLTPTGEGILVNMLPMWEWILTNIAAIRDSRSKFMVGVSDDENAKTAK